DLLTNREPLNQGLALMLDSPAVGWGIHIDRVEIKDVALPESMKRTMARQAEADRERRARIITADGELQASKKLAQAADVMSDSPAALQLRLLQTMVEVASEKSSTVILPFPVELLRFLEHSSLPHAERAAEGRAVNRRRNRAIEEGEGDVADVAESTEPVEPKGIGAAEIPALPEVAPVPQNASEPDPIEEELNRAEAQSSSDGARAASA
ncbi:MAG TPA: SPFH domain-containing protein, partial [Actinocrinis sp.]|nr:SPFH domain-containing protein [Actinocrinis sp.]